MDPVVLSSFKKEDPRRRVVNLLVVDPPVPDSPGAYLVPCSINPQF